MEADAVHPGDLDVPDVTFACPDLSTVCRLDERGLEVTGQRLEPTVRCWLAVSLVPTSSGVAGAAVKASRVTV